MRATDLTKVESWSATDAYTRLMAHVHITFLWLDGDPSGVLKWRRSMNLQCMLAHAYIGTPVIWDTKLRSRSNTKMQHIKSWTSSPNHN